MHYCILGPTSIARALEGQLAGGAERQAVLLAKCLVERGNKVTFVLTGHAETGEIAGFPVRSAWDPGSGMRALRFFTYRLPMLTRVLVQLKADGYYTRGLSITAPTLVDAAHRNGATSVIGLAHDSDLDQTLRQQTIIEKAGVYERLWNGRLAYEYFFHFALRRADWVIAQNQEQAHRCQLMGLRSRVLQNIVETPPETLLHSEETIDITWIGHLSRWKGVDTLLALARLLPDVSFRVIGPFRDEMMAPVVDQLYSQPNVTWSGELPHSRVLDEMSRSRLIINTSPAEGFANIILEAWSLGKPVITFQVNPNQLMSGSNRIGECAGGDLLRMAALVREYLEKPEYRRIVGERARQYIQANHSSEVVCAAFVDLFGNITR